ncbi:MAG TPA: hypothetical protein HPQ04_03210 [Rhodospirillaceae bacterium]|nr:hypothetical protein [Rhodospirillaceae bacterium]
MKFDSFFRRHDPGSSWRERKEPVIDAPGRSMVPTRRPSGADVIEEQDLPPPSINIHIEPRRMSPRQLAQWAHEMYLAGALNWQDYLFAGFPAELHPEYNRTVGVLTGRRAQPDWPRDMVREWEDRLAFVRRHNDPCDGTVKRAEKVLTLLRRQEAETYR